MQYNPTPEQVAIYQQARKCARALPPLVADAMAVAQAVQSGPYGLRRAGTGGDFWQFREYQGGESASAIDWKQSARGNKLYVREKERDISQNVNLWIDASLSMNDRSASGLPTKGEAAHILLLGLSYLLLQGGETVSWMDCKGIPLLINERGASGFDRLAAKVLPIAESGCGLPPILAVKKHSHVVFCGDFSAPLEQWKERVSVFVGMGIRGVLLQIASPSEAIGERCAEAWKEHSCRVGQLADEFGWRCLHHSTDENVSATLARLCYVIERGFDHNGLWP